MPGPKKNGGKAHVPDNRVKPMRPKQVWKYKAEESLELSTASKKGAIGAVPTKEL